MNVFKILNQLKIKPQKRWGQNFLQNESKAKAIINQFQIKNDNPILEIGPGLGMLTTFLIQKLKKENKLILIEKDYKLYEFLQKFQKENKNITLYNEDVFEMNWEETIKNNYQVIGNLPYNIATQILKFFLMKRTKIISLFFSFPEAIGEKILAERGSKNYGFLTIFVKLFSDIKKKITLDENDFFPKPKIKSMFLEFIPKKKLIIEENLPLFIDFLKKCFAYKRKTLINNWKIAYNLKNDEMLKLIQFFKTTKIDEKIRAEMCTLEDFKFFFDHWKHFQK